MTSHPRTAASTTGQPSAYASQGSQYGTDPRSDMTGLTASAPGSEAPPPSSPFKRQAPSTGAPHADGTLDDIIQDPDRHLHQHHLKTDNAQYFRPLNANTESFRPRTARSEDSKRELSTKAPSRSVDAIAAESGATKCTYVSGPWVVEGNDGTGHATILHTSCKEPSGFRRLDNGGKVLLGDDRTGGKRGDLLVVPSGAYTLTEAVKNAELFENFNHEEYLADLEAEKFTAQTNPGPITSTVTTFVEAGGTRYTVRGNDILQAEARSTVPYMERTKSGLIHFETREDGRHFFTPPAGGARGQLETITTTTEPVTFMASPVIPAPPPMTASRYPGASSAANAQSSRYAGSSVNTHYPPPPPSPRPIEFSSASREGGAWQPGYLVETKWAQPAQTGFSLGSVNGFGYLLTGQNEGREIWTPLGFPVSVRERPSAPRGSHASDGSDHYDAVSQRDQPVDRFNFDGVHSALPTTNGSEAPPRSSPAGQVQRSQPSHPSDWLRGV